MWSRGNYIGLARDGLTPVSGPDGVGVVVQGAATGNIIGGTASGARNVVSGNTGGNLEITDVGTSGNSVEGNIIGLAADGKTVVLGDTGLGLAIESGATNNAIGGSVAGAGNVISGNATDVIIQGAGTSGNLVQGNIVGLDADGLTPASDVDGIFILNGPSANTIGGTTAGARNVLSGSATDVTLDGSTNDVVEGNDIGLASDGTTPVGTGTGVGVFLTTGATGDTVGGTVAGARNLISGLSIGVSIANSGAANDVVEGNYIGLAADGITPRGNKEGVDINGNATGNTIGGTTAGARNVISGNTAGGEGYGIFIFGVPVVGDVIEGNYIGLDASGTVAVPNAVGIVLGVNTSSRGSAITVGGTAAGAGNVISGNSGIGVDLVYGQSDLIAGNIIGLNALGAVKVPNASGVQVVGGLDTIGGTNSAARNVISGNSGDGVDVLDSGVLVEGNNIGTDVSGTLAEGNSGSGIVINATAVDGLNTIGGTASGGRQRHLRERGEWHHDPRLPGPTDPGKHHRPGLERPGLDRQWGRGGGRLEFLQLRREHDRRLGRGGPEPHLRELGPGDLRFGVDGRRPDPGEHDRPGGRWHDGQAECLGDHPGPGRRQHDDRRDDLGRPERHLGQHGRGDQHRQ